jgi:hypothetical protein
VRWRPYPSRRLALDDISPFPRTLARRQDNRRLCRPRRQGARREPGAAAGGQNGPRRQDRCLAFPEDASQIALKDFL